MKLEDQVCSLELAKRLKELGVKQDSYFVWCLGGLSSIHAYEKACGEAGYTPSYKSAFTAAELADFFPKGGSWTQEATAGGYRVWMFDREPPHNPKEYTWSETEANARAKMLIHLIESGLIEMPK